MHRREMQGRVVRIVVVVAVAAAAGLPWAAGAQTGDERRAYAELDSAARDVQRSVSGGLPAARRVLQAAERAHRVYQQADGRRDAADERFHAAERIIRRTTRGANAADAQAKAAAVYYTNAEYVEAVGERGAGSVRQAGDRVRSIMQQSNSLAARLTVENITQFNARHKGLMEEWEDLNHQNSETHNRANAAHVAANRAWLQALEGAARTVLTAADRMVQRDYPFTGQGRVWRAHAALERARGNAVAPGVEDGSDRTDAAVEGVMTAMRVTLDVLDLHLQAVGREVAAIEQRYAGPGEGADTGPQEPTGGDAPPPGAVGGGEPPREPTTLREWAGYLVNLLNEIEGYVTAAAQTENSIQCMNVATAQNNASSRLYNLVGRGRPEFIPADLDLLDGFWERERAAQSQVIGICADKPRP